jgi:chemotaxis protein CheX
MTNNDRDTLAALLVQMCREMLAPSGESFEVVLVDPAPAGTDEQDMLAASVGLGRSRLRGALVVLASPSFFRATYPGEAVRETGVADEDLADWAGELGNQLLGRIKNRLCQLGLEFSVGAPTVVRGGRLRLRPGDGPSRVACRLRVRNERVDLFLEIIAEDGEPLLTASAAPAPTTSTEGDTLLF